MGFLCFTECIKQVVLTWQQNPVIGFAMACVLHSSYHVCLCSVFAHWNACMKMYGSIVYI